MQILIESCKERRMRASSSHSVYAPPVTSVVDGSLYVLAGWIRCLISDKGVSFSPEIGTVIVNGCTFCDTGVWLSIASGEFWLEIRVQPLSDREIQLRAATRRA